MGLGPFSEPVAIEVELPTVWSEPVAIEVLGGPSINPWSEPVSINTARHYEWKIATASGWINGMFFHL